MTDKQTIFFSHSTRDKSLLVALKSEFEERTGGVYTVFLSSDGSSIPFGRNWTKSVEEGLEHAKLMYVFLTPASLASPWIYFESGFAYAKGVRVVPIGLEEVDLAGVSPPLSLLQGFNLRNFEGLNNLLAIANETFAHSHKLSFRELDFEKLFLGTAEGPRRALGRHADFVDELRIHLRGATREFRSMDLLASLSAVATERNLVHEHSGNVISLHGATLTASGDSSSPESVDIKIDCLAVDSAFPMVLDLLGDLPSDVTPPSVDVMFFVGVRALRDWHRVTARLLGTNGTFGPGRTLHLEECAFQIEHTFAFRRGDATRAYLSIRKPDAIAHLSDIRQIVDFSFERGLLSVSPDETFE